MSRKNTTRDLPDPEDVLKGRVRATTAVYFALIHATNPTGRDLAPRERDRRYALKARLQSALIRDHGELLSVTPSAEDPRVVSLNHADLDEDAAHARLDALDEDARAWVQRRLDEAHSDDADPTPSPRSHQPRGRADAASTLTPLAAGRRALEEYDFDTARGCFEAALEVEPEASVELLALLVDTLALDEDAVALAARLSARDQVRPENRARLAVAHARLGDETGSLRWQKGLDGMWLAEGAIALLARALRDGDLGRASAHLAALDQRELSHAELPGLRDGLMRLRAERRAVDEARIVAAAGDDEAQRTTARDVLDRWPDSAVARTTLARLDAAARARTAEERLDQGSKALAAGDVVRALALTTEARRLGALVADAELDALRARVRATEDVMAAQGIVGALPDFDAAARLYLEASSTARAAARRESRDVRFDWLDVLSESWGGAPGRRAASWFAAIEARARAEEAASDGRFEDALGVLSPHADAWSRAPEMARRLVQLQERARLERARVAREQLDRAAALVGERDLAGARAALDGLALEVLESADRARHASIAAEVESWWRRTGLMARVAAAEQAGEWMEARAALEALLESSADEDLRERARGADARVSAARGLRAWEMEGLGIDLADLGAELLSIDTHCAWLTGDGRTLVVPIVKGRRILLAERARQAREVHRVTEFLFAERASLVDSMCVDDTVVVAGIDEMVVLDRTRLRVLQHLRVPVPRGGDVGRLYPVPRRPYVWAELRQPGDERGDFGFSVWSTERRRFERTLGTWHTIEAVPGPEPSIVGGTDSVILCDPRGHRRQEWKLPAARVEAGEALPVAMIHPDGRRLIAMGTDEREGAQNPTTLIVLEDGGRLGASLPIPDMWFESRYQMATSRSAGLVFVAYPVDGAFRLICVSAPADGGLSLRWSVRAESLPTFVNDVDAHHVTALFVADDGVHEIELGADPPTWTPSAKDSTCVPGAFGCRPSYGRGRALRERAHEEQAGELQRRLDGARSAAELDEVWQVAHDLDRLDVADAVLARMIREHPGDPATLLASAERAAGRREWAEVERLLSAGGPGQEAHHAHLRSDALLALGRNQDAVRVLEAGVAAHPNKYGCALERRLQMACVLAGHEPDGNLGRLVAALEAADEALARQDLWAAFRVLVAPPVLAHRELQSAVRLGHAALGLPLAELSAADAIRRRIALVQLVHVATKDFGVREVQLPGTRAWSPARVAEVVAEAERALEG